MSEVTSTNIRAGHGVYLALRNLSEKSGMSMGSWANLLIAAALLSGDVKNLSWFPPEIQSALMADVLSAFGDLLKAVGMEGLRSSNMFDLYQKLLNPPKEG